MKKQNLIIFKNRFFKNFQKSTFLKLQTFFEKRKSANFIKFCFLNNSETVRDFSEIQKVPGQVIHGLSA